MELNVGDYVRTKDYGIRKISKFFKTPYLDYIICNNSFSIEQIDITQIIKSSPNIIDLIEVGDYVNGHRVSYSGGFYQYWDDMFDKNKIETDKDIKSVLTHEQFEAMKYVVGDTNVKD